MRIEPVSRRSPAYVVNEVLNNIKQSVGKYLTFGDKEKSVKHGNKQRLEVKKSRTKER